MRKILMSIALLAVVCRAAAEDFRIGDCYYTITSATTVTLDQVRDAAGHVEIASHVSYSGYDFTVTAIAQSCFRETIISSVSIPATVTTIGGNAFSTCPMLREITLPVGLEEVPYGCFGNCERLASVSMPLTVKRIGEGAFKGCTSLEKIELHEGIAEIGGEAFSQCAVREMVLPASFTFLGSKAFQSSKALESIVIKGDIGSLADHVFANCTALQRIVLEHPVESLGEGAFEGCASLADIELPEGLTAIRMNCFDGCGSLQELTLPASIRTLEGGCFQNSGLTRITIPEGVETLEASTFGECASLTSVGMPRTLTRIGDFAFYHCASLKEVVIPENVIQVGRWSFSGCSSLERVVCRSTNLNTEYIVDNTFDDSHYSRVQLTVPTGQKASYTANERWNRFAGITESDLGPNYNYAKVHVAKHGAVAYEGETLVGDTNGGDLKQYTISYEEGKDTYLTILPDENYEPDIGVYNALPQWKEAEEYMKGNELHFGADSRPTEIVVHFQDLYSIITIRQGEGGCFQLRAQRNHQYQYRANPLSGWQLHSITYDGTDMTAMLDERQMLQTPPLTHDVTLNIAFEKIETGIAATAHEPAIHVYGSDGTLHIEHAEPGESISIYTADGVLAGTWVAQTDSMQVKLPSNKLYIVSSKQKRVKIWL